MHGARTAMTCVVSTVESAADGAGINSVAAPMGLTPLPTALSHVKMCATKIIGACSDSTVSV